MLILILSIMMVLVIIISSTQHREAMEDGEEHTIRKVVIIRIDLHKRRC